MTQKRLVLETISELPDEVSLDEIAERIEFLVAIQKGIDQLDRGEGIPHEEIKRQLATWLAKKRRERVHRLRVTTFPREPTVARAGRK